MGLQDEAISMHLREGRFELQGASYPPHNNKGRRETVYPHRIHKTSYARLLMTPP
ncbi:hypothetical protein K443DRAFT_678878 [Laccaria amethystina LaAM-08-1]|uniref:Uncharacterized protein n=1 Tax=Laccaria amethystina LaAM-08-1 TaxID=1095629 RepID=A0A0C9X724_9AGAR|nr:hypothetical protein K443DRAFT_678878 [Laccaria amethystina LaAM-08-1]